jgi:DNA-binding LacI/PurR family transcriptional regulator
MPKILPSTKHFKLAQQLRTYIRTVKPGDSFPTLVELQETFGVSQATVDRAIDRLRREGLVTRPAGQLRLVVAEISDPAAHRIALIRPDYPSPTFEELARVIVDAGKTHDWAFDLVCYRKLEGLSLRRAIGDNDAAILLPTSEPFPEQLHAALRRPPCPMLIIQDPPAGLRVGSVRIDDSQIGDLATRHLIELGHRRILLFLSEPMAPSGRLRAEGWRSAMMELGERNIDELVVDSQVKPFDNSMIASYHYFSQWLSTPHPPFTAVFCAAWTGAIAVLRAMREHGIRVPDDVSVTSHGGEGYIAPFLVPALTAVETDLQVYGKKVVSLLQKQMDNPKEPVRSVVVPSKLVIRGTTGPVSVPV